MLAHERVGTATDAPRLTLAHGFTQNARCWGEFGALLSDSFAVVGVDAPGHGRSGHNDADLHQAGQLIAEAAGPAHYLGYSMGGRMLLHKALNDPAAQLTSLVLIGATAGIESATERAERADTDARRANHILDIGTHAFIEEWLATPMFAELTAAQSCKAERFENSAVGMAASLRNCGAGSQEPLWSQLSSLAMPVLIVAGSRDDKYTDLGRRMATAIGSNAQFMSVAGGHAVHLQSPVETSEAVAAWIDGLD